MCRSDVKCGQLFCATTENKSQSVWDEYYKLDTNIYIRNIRYECDAVTVDAGTQSTDPGLVSDGTKCGNAKVTFLFFWTPGRFSRENEKLLRSIKTLMAINPGTSPQQSSRVQQGGIVTLC